ncbi:MAG: sulfatase-like hydrolase/transferase [Planctomycetes bacterium]|nr:sulfatase-like hydrolase/transferase [Planctomycetota bacterium]
MGAGDEITAQQNTPSGGKQPNILMLFSDEHNAFMSGFMGHGMVETPNLDRLSAEGVTFDRAYCNSPLCSPSRQSFMAGLHCHNIDMWNNTSAMPPDTVTWAHMLSHAGYETSLIGKMHFNGYQKMYGFDRRPVLEGNQRGESFYSWGLRTSHDWTAPLPYTDGDMQPQLIDAGPDVPERDPVFRKDFEVLKATLAVIREKAGASSPKPWAVCAAFVLPHPPWKARPDILGRYRGKGDLPFNRTGEGRDTCDRYMQQYYGEPARLTDGQIRNAREVYWSLITEFDEYAGRILDCLEETGLADDTIVLYFSDHGEMAGEHGMWGKVTLLESSVRVPLAVRWPGKYEKGKRVATPVSLVDLYPTLLEWAGTALPDPLPLDGHSLLPLLEGRPADFRGGTVFGEFEGEGWNHPRAFLVNGDYKYVYNHTAEERLYDLREDPHETKDLSADSAHAAALQRMREQLLENWDPEDIENRVLMAQARRKIARVKYVCKDFGI